MKLLFCILFIANTSLAGEFTLSKKVFSSKDFIPKTGAGKYDSYLQMDIDFDSVKELFGKVDKKLEGKLSKENARTEAHITVITPIEYREVLEPAGLSISDINKIARKEDIQKSKFEIICLGQGSSKDLKNQTYYIVVESRELIELRDEIFQAYLKKGGHPSLFDPESFYPHITVGYTSRDLHLGGDGVYKGENSCWSKLDLI